MWWTGERRRSEEHGGGRGRVSGESGPIIKIREDRRFILGVLTTGHGISHWFDQAFMILLPSITASLGLSALQVGTLGAIRQVGFGVVNLPGGFIVDMLKGQWGLILTGCMVWSALAYALLGSSYVFPVLLVAVVMLSLPGAVWHLPSTAALSQRFPDWRGFAISIHGFGANLGNFLGPVSAGALLGLLHWRGILYIYTVPALVMAIVVWVTLRNIGRDVQGEERRDFREQARSAISLLKNRPVLGLATVALLRDMALTALFLWTPFYLKDVIGMSDWNMGLHMGLVTGTGVLSTPILGFLSDRFNRKLVLVPGLAICVVLLFMVTNVGGGWELTAILAILGLFTFALHQIIQASVLDHATRGAEATAIGFLFSASSIVGAISNIIAAIIVDNYGLVNVFYFQAALTAASLLLLLPLRISRAQVVVSSSQDDA